MGDLTFTYGFFSDVSKMETTVSDGKRKIAFDW